MAAILTMMPPMLDRVLKPTFNIESGDGMGCSIADAKARNDLGICAVYGCGAAIMPDAVPYVLVQKLCPMCERSHCESMDCF